MAANAKGNLLWGLGDFENTYQSCGAKGQHEI